ncbi:hypothetical protein JTF08_13625 [Micrococcaceae bacterium RIT802]|nr:hypothetical protein [Micrococcaceae bacterium RIT 802]
MKFVVNAEDMSSALRAVVAHATTKADDGYMRTVDLQITEAGQMLVTASNGSTSGVARVRLVDFAGELGRFALDRDDVDLVRSTFGDGRVDLEISVTESRMEQTHPDEKPEVVHSVQVRELGAMFGGRSLRISTADQSKRDVAGLWHAIAAGLARKLPPLGSTAFHPADMAKFRNASLAYGEDLRIVPADGFGSLLVHCGRDFVGFMNADARAGEEFDETREAWRDALPLKLAKVGS